MSITLPECLILSLYFGGNVATLYLGRANLATTAARLATINATPLFLGGRTNPLADFAGVPLSTYYIFHHFIGRIVIAEGLLHSALALQRSRPDQATTSGYIVRRTLQSFETRANIRRLLADSYLFSVRRFGFCVAFSTGALVRFTLFLRSLCWPEPLGISSASPLPKLRSLSSSLVPCGR